MKKLFIFSLTCLMSVSFSAGAFAQPQYAMVIPQDESISPYYIAIATCKNDLHVSNSGKLTCIGKTYVQDSYVAKVTIHVQQKKNGSWTTIKTWSGEKNNMISLSKSLYVNPGTYRLQLIHEAIDSRGKTIETVKDYSTTVTYS